MRERGNARFFFEDFSDKPPPRLRFMGVMKYQCTVCKYIYDEEKEGVKWHELPDDWRCPKCKAPKRVFVPMREPKPPENV